MATKTLFFRWRAGAVLFLAASLGGCDFDRDPVEPQQASVVPEGRTYEFADGVFDLIVTASGSYVPGGAITVTANYTARMAAAKAHVSITFPDLAALIRTSGDPTVIPVNVPLGAHSQWNMSLAPGQRGSRSATINVLRGGYYRAVVRIEDIDAKPIQNGRAVQTVNTQEIWLFVAEHNGQATREFNVTLFADSLIPVPGIFRKHPRFAAIESGASQASNLQVSCLYGYATYYNADSGLNEYVRGALLKAWIIDKYNGNYTTTVSSDETGFYEICAEGGSSAAYVDAYLYPETSNLVPEDTTNIGRAVGTGRVDIAATSDVRAHVYTNLRESILPTYTQFEVVPRTATYAVNASDNTQPYAYYLIGQSKIVIKAGGIYGEYGRFVAAHEYGHLIQDVAFGWPLVSNDGGCPSPHYLWAESSLYCAMTEGWANYFAVVNRPSAIPNYLAEIESRCCLSTSQDGARVENAVAAFIYDIGDGANESHDAIALGHAYVARIYDTCNAYWDLAWRGANGADHVAYCMENYVDPNVTSSTIYFTSRSPDPTDQQNSAGQPTGWSASPIRTIWRHNLYFGS